MNMFFKIFALEVGLGQEELQGIWVKITKTPVVFFNQKITTLSQT